MQHVTKMPCRIKASSVLVCLHLPWMPSVGAAPRLDVVLSFSRSVTCTLQCTCMQVREDELEQPVKVVKKRSLPAGGGGSGRSRGGGRGGWGPWQRSLSSSSTKTDPDKDTESAPTAPQAAGSTPAAAAAAADGDQGPEKDDNMQRLYGLWQTEAFVRRAEDGKVPKNDRGNIEVPPFAKALPLGEPVVHLAKVY